AIALGGSVSLGAQGVLLVGLGLLLAAAPPPRGLDRFAAILLAGWLLLPLAAFFPAGWLPGSALGWRNGLTQELGLPAGRFFSLQPWLSWEGWWMLAGSAAWAACLACRVWTEERRRAALGVYAGGLALLTLVALAAWGSGRAVPLWRAWFGFGFFPNK